MVYVILVDVGLGVGVTLVMVLMIFLFTSFPFFRVKFVVLLRTCIPNRTVMIASWLVRFLFEMLAIAVSWLPNTLLLASKSGLRRVEEERLGRRNGSGWTGNFRTSAPTL